MITGGSGAVYSPSGHIVYARAGKLFAAAFDLQRREVTGAPMQVVDGVMMSQNTGAAHFAMSRRGDLAYVPGGVEGGNRGSSGRPFGKTETLPLRVSFVSVSADCSRRPLDSCRNRGAESRFLLLRFRAHRLQQSEHRRHEPQSGLVTGRQASRLQVLDCRWHDHVADERGSKRHSRATRPKNIRQNPVSFSPDGKFLAFDRGRAERRRRLGSAPLWRRRGAANLRLAKAGEGSAKFSPDGRWVAYSSTESGDEPQIYVQPFPGLGPKLQISNAGGTDPMWRRMGGELYYREGDR